MTTATATVGCVIRRATPEDAAVCGRICYEAFATLNRKHNFPPDVPDQETGARLMSWMFSHPGMYCVVAEVEGRIVGSNCLDERGIIAGIGPITIDPTSQDSGIGRTLMVAVMERANERKAAGLRLVQAAFHGRSMSLYAKLGFDVREPLVVMQGAPLKRQIDGYTVRPATAIDVEDCRRLCLRVHGHERSEELWDGIAQGIAMAVERGGKLAGYTSALGFFGHAVAESNGPMQALIAGAEQFLGPGFLLPTRNTELFRWCLGHGLRVVEPMTLMAVGLYNEPVGAFLPSILF